MRPDIIYEDDWLLAADKPAGMAVQSASVRQTDLTDLVRARLVEKRGSRQDVPYLGIVHRLDQPVRGLVVFALNEKSAANLSAQAAGRGKPMEKTYLAVVKAGPEMPDIPDDGLLLTDYLLRDGRTNLSRVVPRGTAGAKRAELHISLAGFRTAASKDCGITEDDIFDREAYAAAMRIFERDLQAAEKEELTGAEEEQTAAEKELTGAEETQNTGGEEFRPALREGSAEIRYAVLRIRLLTGRHHQIRVQLSAAGMPILGDQKYGQKERQHSRQQRFPALCAWRMKLIHPESGEWMCFESKQE